MATYSQNPIADTTLDTEFQDANFGNDGQIWSGETDNNPWVDRALLIWDLSSIPSNATVTSGYFQLYKQMDYSSIDRYHRFYRMRRSWGYTSATWLTYNGVNSWGSPGANSTSTDYDATPMASYYIGANEAGGYKTFPLDGNGVAIMQAIINGTYPNYGFQLRADTENNDNIEWTSREGTNKPLLVIQYTVPGPSLSRSVSPSSSKSPSKSPSMSPSLSPSISPSLSRSKSPSISPSVSPSPSTSPSQSPSKSISPSKSPSMSPSLSPSKSPSKSPSISPSASPSISPSLSPSFAPPDAFSKISPLDNEIISGTTVTLNWQSTAGATSYEYAYGTGTTPTNWTSVGNNTTATLVDLVPNTKYYWGIKGVNVSNFTYANDNDYWELNISEGGGFLSFLS